ncbi:MAG: hypothetical protein JW849_08765 [Phycisphaerae bacterium]|nr:hypothetical protein [Phycisphaerae bacterium]
MKKLLCLCLLSPCFGGCGGYYLLTVPDQLAKSDGELVPVIRLQRNDFFFLALPARNQAMRFTLYPTPDTSPGAAGESPLRSAGTDKTGYAGVLFSMSRKPVRGKAGLYYMKVALQDVEGAEISAAVPLFVWDSASSVVAVDYDSLPRGYGPDDPAVAALRNIARSAHVVYFTRQSRRTREDAHRRLADAGYPDGPILLWQRKSWHVVREGKFKLPRVRIENRLEGHLPGLVEQFPKMRYGVCTSEAAARAFVDAGMKCVVVGNASMSGSRLIHRDSWDHLARQGLPKD